jgi:hypothetical protein
VVVVYKNQHAHANWDHHSSKGNELIPRKCFCMLCAERVNL